MDKDLLFKSKTFWLHWSSEDYAVGNGISLELILNIRKRDL